MFYSLFLSSLRILKAHKSRTVLTCIGIVIGISSVIIMIGITSSAKTVIRKKILSYGTNAMMISRLYGPLLTEENADDLRQLRNFKYVSRVVSDTDIPVSYLNRRGVANVYGADNDYLMLQGMRMLNGRMFSEGEVRRGERVVILGDAVRIKYFGFTDPTDKVIFIKRQPFKVIASLVPRGISLTGDDMDNICIVPARAGVRAIGLFFGSAAIYASSKDEASFKEAVFSADSYLTKERGILKGKRKDFDIESNSKNESLADDISLTLTYLLLSIASISLIVGGIGIMNIMLVSVSERTREIGIRMAIGAKKMNILAQFLMEAVILCSLGGLSGIVIGIVVYFGITSYLGWNFIFSPLSVIISFSFASFVGLLFGFYPAKIASELNPIDALRTE